MRMLRMQNLLSSQKKNTIFRLRWCAFYSFNLFAEALAWERGWILHICTFYHEPRCTKATLLWHSCWNSAFLFVLISHYCFFASLSSVIAWYLTTMLWRVRPFYVCLSQCRVSRHGMYLSCDKFKKKKKEKKAKCFVVVVVVVTQWAHLRSR